MVFLLVYLLCLLLLAFFIAGLYIIYVKHQKNKHASSFIEKWNYIKEAGNSIDTPFDSLDIECAEKDFIPSQLLLMRGSWRLAQGGYFSYTKFETLKADEYSKKLR